MIVTLAGHVDHGKTAIVKALTGVDTDRLEEEKRRGLTIDLGFAYHDFGDNRVGFVDVPGHHRFVHNMIAGVANMQHALLVVAADDGVMPQTQEHLNILQLLGLSRGTIVLNKIDLVDENRISEVADQIRDMASSTFLEDCTIIEASTTTGRGIDQLRELLTEVAGRFQRQTRQRAERIAIDRSFSPRGVGAVVTGSVFDGEIQVGDELVLSSSGNRVRIRSLVTNGEPTTKAQEGDRCGIQVSGESASNISRGDWLRNPENFVRTKQATVQLRVLADFPRQLRNWTPVHLYHATSHVQARILPLQNTLSPGSVGLADVESDEYLDVVIGDRVIIRDHDLQRTLGGGLVVDVDRPNIRRRHPERIEQLQDLVLIVQSGDVGAAFERICAERCVRLNDFRQAWNLSSIAVPELTDHSELVELNGRYLQRSKLEQVTKQLQSTLIKYHKESPSEFGETLPHLATECKLDRETAQFVLACGVRQGVLRTSSGRYALSSHIADAPTYNKELFEQIRQHIEITQPLTTGDIAKVLRIPLRHLEMEMKRMAVARVLVQVTPKRYFAPLQLKELAELALSLGSTQPFSVKDFRDKSGIGRMPVIDVLEYFDRLKFTKRIENERTVIGSIENIDST